jgi:site-specific DNA-methyltransferase (adenine-specific)
MKEIPDGSIDLIMCDLPYGTTRNKWDSIIPFEPLWNQYERIIKENGAIVLFAQTPFDKELAMSNVALFKYEWIWEKAQGTGHLNAKKMPMKSHENILVFYKKLPTYNPQWEWSKPYTKTRSTHSSSYGNQKDNSTTVSDGRRYPKDVIRISKSGNDRRLHPTQKPVALLEYLIKTYTNEGDVVLDNCMGSGSTCVAAVNTNRHYIGFEIEPQYFQIASERIKEAEQAMKGENHAEIH